MLLARVINLSRILIIFALDAESRVDFVSLELLDACQPIVSRPIKYFEDAETRTPDLSISILLVRYQYITFILGYINDKFGPLITA